MAFSPTQRRGPFPVWVTVLLSLTLGYLLCYASQSLRQPTPASRGNIVRRMTSEDDGPIPHGPSRVPVGRCCCSGGGGVCISEQDFNAMFKSNSSHPERFSHITVLRQEAAWNPYPTFTELHQTLYRTEPNVYDNFHMPQGITDGFWESHVNDAAMELFRKLLGRPVKLMIEVGSASGNSAAVWGAELRQNEGVLVAFDTWNGDLDMWLSESFRDVMGWQDGHSHLYERFLNRMVKEGLTGTVLPVRTTAPVGARMMGVLNYTVDAIYLDAAQEGGELYLDLSLYWDLLSPGGVLMGDDYMWFWGSVVHDVDLFMKHAGLPSGSLHFSSDWDFWQGSGVWALQKPLDAPLLAIS